MVIDFTSDGLTGEWVDVVDIAKYSPKQMKALRSLPTSAEALADLSEDDAADAARAFIKLMVTSWLVRDPETGEQLPPPSSTSLDPQCIPTIVSARIAAELRGRMEEIQNLKARSRQP